MCPLLSRFSSPLNTGIAAIATIEMDLRCVFSSPFGIAVTLVRFRADGKAPFGELWRTCGAAKFASSGTPLGMRCADPQRAFSVLGPRRHCWYAPVIG